MTWNIMEAASSLGLLRKEYAWIMTMEAIPMGMRNSDRLPIGLLGMKFQHCIVSFIVPCKLCKFCSYCVDCFLLF